MFSKLEILEICVHCNHSAEDLPNRYTTMKKAETDSSSLYPYSVSMCSAPLINTTLTLSVIVKCDTPHICFTRTDNKWDRKTHLATRDFYNSIISVFFDFNFISFKHFKYTYVFNADVDFENIGLMTALNNLLIWVTILFTRHPFVSSDAYQWRVGGWDPAPGVVTGQSQWSWSAPTRTDQ